MTALTPDAAERVAKGYERGAEHITVFATAMAHELESNAHKGDPTHQPAIDHVRELLYHTAKLYMAVRYGNRTATLEYAADCGNHAWMAAAAAGVLDQSLLTSGLEGAPSQGIYDGDKDAQAAQEALTRRAEANLGRIFTGEELAAEEDRLVREVPWTFKTADGGYYEPLKELGRAFGKQLADLIVEQEKAHGRPEPLQGVELGAHNRPPEEAGDGF